MIPLIDLKIQHKSIASEVEAAIKNVCANTAFILSDEMKAFEAEFAAYCGVKHGIGVAKRPYFLSHMPPENLAVMRSVKDALDAKHILNDHISYLE